jgi:alpha-ketoglutarate-dependent 2,4-dichlorophenoxyacetate dioxygenase
MMAIDLKILHPELAVEVSGIDLRKPLEADVLAELKSTLARYPVLVFHDQKLSDNEHAAFTRCFGSIDAGLTLASKRKQRLKNTDVIDLANIDGDGKVLDAANARNVSLLANQLWHSDSSFKSPRAQYSVLCGVDLPEEGGDTEFADQRAAYDALSQAMKVRIEPLVAEHSAFHSRGLLGGADFTPEGMAALPPVDWPIVNTIPESGRKSLFIGVHTREIRGMATAEARLLLLDLLEHATQRDFVFRHVWHNDDVVMWDNRCTLHRGRPYDLSKLRELRRCTTEYIAA